MGMRTKTTRKPKPTPYPKEVSLHLSLNFDGRPVASVVAKSMVPPGDQLVPLMNALMQGYLQGRYPTPPAEATKH